jgi:hypothetical protein
MFFPSQLKHPSESCKEPHSDFIARNIHEEPPIPKNHTQILQHEITDKSQREERTEIPKRQTHK